MPSFVVTATIPLLAMLAIRQLDPRKVMAALPVVYLPDLDYLVGVHRASLHNVFVLVPFLAWFWWEMDRGAGWARGEWPLVVAGYLTSHLIMDAFVGGISPLWPLAPQAIFLWVAIRVDTTTNTPEIIFDPGTLPGAPATSESFLWLSPTDVAIVVVVATAAAVTVWLRSLRTSDAVDEGP